MLLTLLSVSPLLCMYLGGLVAQEVHLELPPQDGVFNNLGQPTAGSVGSRLARKSGAGYSDGAYQMSGQKRPSPLDISQRVHSGATPTSSAFGRNAMLVFFSQLVLDEILVTGQPGCPPEYQNLDIPSSHPLSKSTQRPMVYQRSAYDQRTGYSPNVPREQTNGVTSFLDGGVIYGTSRMWTNHLRSFKDGALMGTSNSAVKATFPYLNELGLPFSNQPVPRDHKVKHIHRLYAIGNAKGHETPFLLALQIVWLRYHNKLARDIKQADPTLSDQRVFQRARKTVVATFQRIVVEEWLPAFLNGNGTSSDDFDSLPEYTGYKAAVAPGITQEFRTSSNWRLSLLPAAVPTLQYWPVSNSQQSTIVKTTGLPPGTSFVNFSTPGRGPKNEARDVNSVRLCNNFWDSQELVKDNTVLNSLLRGMLWTFSEKEDQVIVPDVREFFYGPFEFSRLDGVAKEIQRDRDHGVGTLNSVLEAVEMTPVSNWSDLGPGYKALQDLYPSGTERPDDVDLFTGAMLADVSSNDSRGMPEVFRKIVLDQFQRIRDADRFWFQNSRNGLFTTDEVTQIRQTSFRDVLLATTDLTTEDVQNVFTCVSTASRQCRAPPDVRDTSDVTVDVCSRLQTYDYFTDSRVSFVLSWIAIGLVLPGSVAVLLLLARRRERRQRLKAGIQCKRDSQCSPNKHKAKEWQGVKSGERAVLVEFDTTRKKILVLGGPGKELRFIDVRQQTSCSVKVAESMMALSLQGEVDLILIFQNQDCCDHFLAALTAFLTAVEVEVTKTTMTEAQIKENSVNSDDRKDVLDEFFRIALLQVMKEEEGGRKCGCSDAAKIESVSAVHLTRTELAEALGMRPSSIFVRNVFLLADKDHDGFITFHEFVGLFAIFIKGSAEEKALLLFNVYDVLRRGVLTRDDFTKMIRSLLELSENEGDLHSEQNVEQLVSVMFQQAGIGHKDVMTFSEFKLIFASKEYASTLQAATLPKEGGLGPSQQVSTRKSRLVNSYRMRSRPLSYKGSSTMAVAPQNPNLTRGAPHQRSRIRVSVFVPERELQLRQTGCVYAVTKWIEVYYLHIFWLSLYTLVTCGIFIERAYFYAVGREAAGLRRLSGGWTTAMIRGSASVIMFTYVSLLLTMCRNLITQLRETFFHRFIPFDSAVGFHKYIAVIAMIATIVHIVGHGTNLYCMCTQSTTNVNCFFRNYYTGSNKIATFHYWAFQTITGLAGVIVTILVIILYVFATQWARRKVFTAFWFTHSLYPLIYIFTFLHGIGMLVQAPLFPWYLIGPLVIFVLDRLVSVSRNRVQIAVIKAEILPSEVIHLVFQRPSSFSYKSGQWVRVACLRLGEQEYHPFTLTSAPHERHLSLHIRAVGPWTTHLRDLYDRVLMAGDPYPKLYLDGPFGEGHQDWYSCDVAVLVGGGIGVTPFASIVKDIAFRSRTGALITCQKVYFIWVTRTQKSFEWMTEVIREAEDTDTQNVLCTHIFITQFKQKFDLRTTLLYICEQHFHKVEGRSLFTGLKATTHFGRPDFVEFLFSLQLEHPNVYQFGVFSCGPGPMTSAVQNACTVLNKTEGYTYKHHYENF